MKKVSFVLSLIIAVMCCTYTADAQFWKNWGKDKDEKKEYRAIYPPPAPPRDEPRKAEEPVKEEEPEILLKDRYRIDILAPFYLNELVQNGKVTYENRYPSKALSGIYFYEGILIAADTLRKMGYNLDVHIHDVTDPMHTPELLVNTDALASSDMIIGLTSSKYFDPITDYAKSRKINFVSALSPSNDNIVNNEYFTLLQPTLQTHCKNVQDRLEKMYDRNPIVMLYRDNVPVDESAYNCFASSGLRFIKRSVNEMPHMEDLEAYFDNTKVNAVVMPIISDDYAEKILKNLYAWFPDYQFEVWGMPSWNDMASLRQPQAFPNVVVYYTSPYYFDKSTAVAKPVIDKYKEKYGVIPNPMVFRGYETMVWYSSMLNKYGTRFNEYLYDNSMSPFTRYNIEVVYDDDNIPMYNENKNLYLYRYQGSIYMVNQ